jgi:hypothetical protein
VPYQSNGNIDGLTSSLSFYKCSAPNLWQRNIFFYQLGAKAHNFTPTFYRMKRASWNLGQDLSLWALKRP